MDEQGAELVLPSSEGLPGRFLGAHNVPCLIGHLDGALSRLSHSEKNLELFEVRGRLMPLEEGRGVHGEVVCQGHLVLLANGLLYCESGTGIPGNEANEHIGIFGPILATIHELKTHLIGLSLGQVGNLHPLLPYLSSLWSILSVHHLVRCHFRLEDEYAIVV